MKQIQIRYASISGNTRAFIDALIEESKIPINAIEISENTLVEQETEPYYVIVPTYLTGGTGIGDDVHEEFTWPLHDYISDQENNNLLGVIGSGNMNFNEQFALTAKRYASDFNVPLLYTYELRGTKTDVTNVLTIMKEVQNGKLQGN